jgi:hypothetical protein
MKPTRSDALAAPVQPFPFHDTTLDVARDNGDLWISIRRVCEILRVDDSVQRKKLRTKPWATEVLITSVAADGRHRQQAYIHLDALPMWLATIEPGRVSEEARPRLERFQVECARALRDHFFGKPHAVEAPPPVPAHEAELPRQPTLEEGEAKRDAMAKHAWKLLEEAYVAQEQAWLWEDRALPAARHACIAKILVELAQLVRESDGGPIDEFSLTEITKKVLEELRRTRTWNGHMRRLVEPEPGVALEVPGTR